MTTILFTETTQIWGKEFPGGMFSMMPGNSYFFISGNPDYSVVLTTLPISGPSDPFPSLPNTASKCLGNNPNQACFYR
jgi:hypothetical protein